MFEVENGAGPHLGMQAERASHLLVVSYGSQHGLAVGNVVHVRAKSLGICLVQGLVPRHDAKKQIPQVSRYDNNSNYIINNSSYLIVLGD
jgi:hypothetical protein